MDIESLILDLESPILGTKMIVEYIEELLDDNMEMNRDELERIYALNIMVNLGIEHIENIRQEYRLAYIKEFEEKHRHLH